jgi:hypothetical protein
MPGAEPPGSEAFILSLPKGTEDLQVMSLTVTYTIWFVLTFLI